MLENLAQNPQPYPPFNDQIIFDHAELKKHYGQVLQLISKSQNHWALDRGTATKDSHRLEGQSHELKSSENYLLSLPPLIQERIELELFHLGPLEALIINPEIDEILIHGQTSISYEFKGQLYSYPDYFLSDSSFMRIFEIISGGFFKSICYENPTGNGHWEGFRIHVIAPPLSHNIQISMRRIGGQKIKSLDELMQRNFVRPEGGALIQKAIDQKLNILICGATSSGKTTFIQCLINACPRDRILILEDSEELKISNSLSTSLICPTRKEQYSVPFTMKDLVKESLRMRPDRIVLGEARSDEAKDYIQALSTGHKGCIASIHASSAKDALVRLECLISQGAPHWSTPVIRQLIASGVNWVIHVEKNSSGLREIKTISEITSLEHTGILLQELYCTNKNNNGL